MDVKAENHYDFLIIGAGGTGLSAAMYAARLNMRSLVLGASSGSELPIGGVITLTDVVENYPGFISLTGTELVQKIEEHAKSYPQVTIKEDRAIDIQKDGQFFIVKTEEEKTYTAATILFATGAKWRELQMVGADTFKNKGVHYCALCDGPVYSGKDVCVIGGSDSAAKEALFLDQHATKVYIIYRGDQIRPEPHNAKLIEKNEKIVVINKTNVVEIKGEKFATSVVLDKPYNGSAEIPLNGIFGAIGHIPLSDLARKMGVLINEKNEIKIDRDSNTNLPGVFAAGDVVDSGFKQLITGVAEGVVASHTAFQYLKKNEIPMALD